MSEAKRVLHGKAIECGDEFFETIATTFDGIEKMLGSEASIAVMNYEVDIAVDMMAKALMPGLREDEIETFRWVMKDRMRSRIKAMNEWN